MFDNKKLFLIKISSQITGPFSKTEVIDMIKSGHLSLLDEVSEPYSIWFYLEDHALFKNIKTQTRLLNNFKNFVTQITSSFTDSQKTTNTHGSDTKTIDQTITKTDTRSDLDFDNQKNQANEASFKVLNKTQTVKKSHTLYQSQKTYQNLVKKQSSVLLRWFWISIAVLSLLMVFYVTYTEIIIPRKIKQEILKNLHTKAIKLYKAAAYAQALPYYEKARTNKILQTKDLLLLGSMYAQKSNFSQVASILDQVSATPAAQTDEYFLLQAMLAMHKKHFTQADNYLKQVSAKHPQALLNFLILKLRQRDFKSYEFYLDQIKYTNLSERGLVFYTKTLNLFFQNKFTDVIQFVDQEISLGTNQALSLEFHQELYLMLAYSYLKTKQHQAFEKALISMFNQDPFFSNQHKYNSYVAIKELSWSMFYPYCKSMYDSNLQNSMIHALYGLCYLKMDMFNKGISIIKNIKNQDPDNVLFASLYAYALMLNNEHLKARQILSLVKTDKIDQNSQILFYIIQASLFEAQEDWHRALKTWQLLLSAKPKHLSGIAGLTTSYYKLNKQVQAKIYLEKGLNLHPYFIKLLAY